MEKLRAGVSPEKKVDFSDQVRFAILLEARVRCGLSRVGKPEFLGFTDGKSDYLHLSNKVNKGEHP